jgi:hypothetical protein
VLTAAMRLRGEAACRLKKSGQLSGVSGLSGPRWGTEATHSAHTAAKFSILHRSADARQPLLLRLIIAG